MLNNSRQTDRWQNRFFRIGASIILLTLLLLIGTSSAALASNTEKRVRVGAYQDPPAIWTDDQGEVRGFLPDILEHIASQEGWMLEYVPMDWCDSVPKLLNREVDLLPGAYPLLNAGNLITLSESPVYVDWGQVYSKEGREIQTVLDLEGKRVAVESSCVFVEGESGIRKLTERFNVETEFQGFSDARKALQDLYADKVDAIVLGRFYHNMEGMRDDIVKTPILLNPVTIYFGAPKGEYATHLQVIDAYIREMKSNRASLYYQSWDKWFSHSLGPDIPKWLLQVAHGLVGAVLLLIGFSLFARYQVEKKTREISEKNQQLRSLSMELTLAEEEERRRLAELLHDNLGQNLALTKIRLSAMEKAHASESCQQSLGDIKSFLNEAIRTTRSLTAEMSPPALYNLTFIGSLKWLAETILRGAQIDFEVIGNGQDIQLSEDAKVLLFKTIRELLVNIVKHAAASYVRIELKEQDGVLQLLIRDNGVGIKDVEAASRNQERIGFGLQHIRERLTYLGGQFEISSEKGQGAQVDLRIPMGGTEHKGKE